MPLVAHSALPSFDRLRAAGMEVLGLERARHQDIRELHVGLLNMMPDAALQATERQFMRLIGSCNRITQIYVHPFAIDAHARGDEAREYIEMYYEDFDRLRADGLDALVVTGANPAEARLEDEIFWRPLLDVLEWALGSVSSVVCSCLATHAFVKHRHGIERWRCEPGKRWGVFSHRTYGRSHPLVAGINTRFDAPHSHVYEVTREQLEDAGMEVLAESEEAGVHLAVSADGVRFVFFQGHPEYDTHSLLKEYKREVSRYLAGERDDWPPAPANYFGEEARRVIEPYASAARAAHSAGDPAPPLPEARLEPWLDNTWSDTGKAMFNNWLGLVYQLTHADRRRLFMPGVDPDDPLGRTAA